ncbi:MAG: 1-deoxy-D-xylulose-5-phosphate reductoisomerase [Planctomycetaceae bacterium]|nr:1-deoxy-D-xylulose-5-phosphate reductoisomerase [Planctomycetaceae bacterium]
MKRLLVLGSTGSIGRQTLELLESDRERFQVVGLAARSSGAELLEQVRRFRPKFVALVSPRAAESIADQLPEGTTLFRGPEALLELIAAADFDLAVHGVVGAAGILPSAEVLRRGKTLALANKESLVAAGAELLELSRQHGAEILPVDSEHCAIQQCLRGEDLGRVRRILLTASGGPFRDLDAAALDNVSPRDALRHPNWDMGPRITVGSSTLMNKALEVIEAHHLFGLESERIDVVIHRQSVVHSLVEFVDGSVVAQMGPPDMRGPIHYALHHPDRYPADLRGFDLSVFRQLTFEAPDRERFPALDLGYRCLREGGDAGCVLNAADEVAVEAFLAGAIGYRDIAALASSVLDERPPAVASLEGILASDARARDLARDAVGRCSVRRNQTPVGG